MTTKKPKPYKIKIEDQQSLHEPSATYQYNTDQIEALKLEALEEIMDLNQTELLRKIIKYLKRIKQNSTPKINPNTLQAMLDAKEGNTINCDSFEDYLKAIK